MQPVDPASRAAKKTYFRAIDMAVPQEGDAMLDVLSHILQSVPSIVPTSGSALTDDECLSRLAEAVAEHEARESGARHLEEVARLIARLAVTIE
jgi:hypothetical protein